TPKSFEVLKYGTAGPASESRGSRQSSGGSFPSFVSGGENAMNDQRKPNLSYEYFLKEGDRLNLLASKRFRNLLAIVRRGWHSPEHEEHLLAMMKSRELELLAIHSPCPPPTLEQVTQGPYRIGTTVEAGPGKPATYPSPPVNFLV